MIEFRCVNGIREQVNPKGLKQVITEFSTKNGAHGVEIVTTLDKESNKGVRTIQKNVLDKIEKVVDDVYGRHEEYTSAYPIYPNGVSQTTADGLKTYFPNISLERLGKY